MANIMASIMLVLLGVLMLKSSSESESLRGCPLDACTNHAKAPEEYEFTQCEIPLDKQNIDDGCSSAQHKHINSTKNCCCECSEGTFMAKRNTCNFCRTHTKCDQNQEVESNGTLAEDRKCKCLSLPIPYEECKRINCTDFPADMTTKRPDTFTSIAQPDVSGYPPTPIELEHCDGRWQRRCIAFIVLFGVSIIVNVCQCIARRMERRLDRIPSI
ncbi:uncharacterized protein LOC117302721 isoform X2 [Asterias rubens]|uniref:uncharacterized protein LOC117302721 isoform X2 n=1 Tax=Asterias rubens TaxID=7604 RepID=UPI00145584AB|nr:uncharacterized protein LOC117302721 isoform X2 [Asterias rubens]